MRKYEDGGAGRAGRSLWVEEESPRRRLPDPVRDSAVRAVLIVAVTLTEATIAFLLMVTGSWLAFPMALCGIAGTVVATWAVLDVLITRQMWNQRHGVVSQPSSTARARRREARASVPARGGRIRQQQAEAAGRAAAWQAAAGDRRYQPGAGRG
ncbi:MULTISPECIES: hypothetical protein [Streptomyces]|uniref:hypothetical protein n=1 Tax=Streptomyces TaxID=1883 RepID=UPI00064D52A1|nr:MULTISPECIES: hypothetical protein [Streptomyces]AKL65207.1 hypothetical protein M444_07190 [Streptomyces sp. Mg1]OKI36506.1 hypothetical protein A6A28_34105 [Streptomyces sp. CB03578]OKI49511.1 hypothetical protein AMK15_33620 [Streptomyces sp. MJM1172]RPK38712.1 hypothetical protein EES37_23180 [Streptomyces sp. ADI91-18]WBY19173.1 hypothetical protein PET44_05770 [Streptomyces goshikiensis]